jgi:diguanylate cyclase (GGDEF)-like protein
MNAPLHALWVGADAPDLARAAFGPIVLLPCASLDDAARRMAQRPHDALAFVAADEPALQSLLHWPALSHAVLDMALVVLAPAASPAQAGALIERGVQDVLHAESADAECLARALRLGVQRRALDRAARRAHATDLATGLPNHAQLLEHMTHLLALREREPAPMALLVLRVEGLASTEAALGSEAANVLRRKLAVRVRAGLRASDVVAAIGTDTFAVLLAWIDSPAAAQRVAGKLLASLQRPFNVAGQPRAVAVSLGLSQYPEHGRLADELLRRAIGQASTVAAIGREGFANRVERGAARAANDEQGEPD